MSAPTPANWTPTSLLAKAVYVAGFLYDPDQQIIYSRMDALQRNFGYAYGYDAAALGMEAIIDCEPIFFDFAGKHWMIELWKGQYGLETGCEIGVYNRVIGSSSAVYTLLDATIGRRTNDSNPAHNLYFDCAADNELLTMSFTLFKNGTPLFTRGREPHWWLTGFKWGIYSQPEELTMDISITCLDDSMAGAFSTALQGMGYSVSVSGATVSFTFATPTTYQPRSSQPALVAAARIAEQGDVAAYNAFGFPSNDPNTIPDSAYSTIIGAIALYGVDFFGRAVADLAKSLALNSYDVINNLVQAFEIGIDIATDWIVEAGYAFAQWVSSFEQALGINLDFSCVVQISNQTGPYELILDAQKINDGFWVIQPPDVIGAGRIGQLVLQDPKPSIHGSDGWVRYRYQDGSGAWQTVTFKFECPTGFLNNDAGCGGPFNFYTKSGSASGGWGSINHVEKKGHPLYVAFVYGQEAPPN